MFTGIVKEVGKIEKITPNESGVEITIFSNDLISNLDVDDSISVNGVCQTVIKKQKNSFTVQAVEVTLEKTNFKSFKIGDLVNLELAMSLSDRLGGHLVQGHVNTIANLLKVDQKGDNYLLTLSLAKSFFKYLLDEGSITLNGISLTLAYVNHQDQSFQVSIIPHTWEKTNLSTVKVGEELNVEVDILAKYVENLLLYNESFNSESSSHQLKQNKLAKNFLSQRGWP